MQSIQNSSVFSSYTDETAFPQPFNNDKTQTLSLKTEKFFITKKMLMHT